MASGDMNTVPTIEWLASYDSVEAFPKLEWSATYSRLQRDSGVVFKLEDPSGYQDGSMFTGAWEPTAGSRSAKHSLSGYEFSKFGSLSLEVAAMGALRRPKCGMR